MVVEPHPDAGCREGFTTCLRCYGLGEVPKDDRHVPGKPVEGGEDGWKTCPKCDGATEVPSHF